MPDLLVKRPDLVGLPMRMCLECQIGKESAENLQVLSRKLRRDLGASLRGADEIAWYTSAWFDKYLKHQRAADKRLLTNRWREDPREAEVDLHHDGNAMSFYYYSRLDIHLADGKPFDCENLRKGCVGMVSEPDPGNYSYVETDTSPEGFDPPKG